MTVEASELRGRHLHLDCASGAAGDMLLGALIDLGVPIEAIGAALDAIGAGRGRLKVQRVVKHGISSIDVKVDTAGELAGAERHVHAAVGPTGDHGDLHGEHAMKPAIRALIKTAIDVHRHDHHLHIPGHDHDHDHDHGPGDHSHGLADHQHGDHGHGDHAHYHYAAIRRRIAEAKLTPGTRGRALDIFDRIARAEAKLHGKTVDDVAFHEVGAIDSVVDIVGTAAALDWLGAPSITCTSVAMGHGTFTCAHGVLPVPSPAALEILRDAGGVMADGGAARELCTPTGAAVLASAVTGWTPAPTGRPIAVGWGAGDAELADRANVLRATAIAPVAQPSAGPGGVWQIDANLDDMSPELCGPAIDAVFAAGALDVWWTPITMKKGRPALMLSALAEAEARDAVTRAILRETTTIGVRFAPRERTVLARSFREVQTAYGPIAIKLATDGDTVVNAAPELEHCLAAARRHAVPVKRVFAAALAAFAAADPQTP
ncbi:MAG TPA: LarC family nickel insertion protein [Kofleriaceae bacterium]